MRMSRKAGLVVSAAVCGALALGAAGEAIASIDDATADPSGTSPQKAPLPNTDTLKAQAKSLGDISGVLTPVTALINDVLAATDTGRLPPDRITTHTTAIRNALATAQQAAGPAAPSAPTVSQPDNGSRPAAGKTATDLRAAALTGLRVKTDALLKTIAAGDSAAVTKAVANSVTALSNFVVSITLGGLPAPDLPGLPTLPRLPGAIS